MHYEKKIHYEKKKHYAIKKTLQKKNITKKKNCFYNHMDYIVNTKVPQGPKCKNSLCIIFILSTQHTLHTHKLETMQQLQSWRNHGGGEMIFFTSTHLNATLVA
jgi:hypothetical protein